MKSSYHCSKILAIFLDRDCKLRANDGRKVWGTVLFLSAIIHKRVLNDMFKNMSFCLVSFSAIFDASRLV